MNQPIIKKLSNGLRVIYVPYKGIDSASVQVHGRAGAKFETPDELGIAHLLEHTVFSATQKYKDREAVNNVIRDVGGAKNASTSKQKVVYYTKTLKEDLETSLDFLSQLVVHPLIQEKFIKEEKEIVKQELHGRFDVPRARFWYDAFKTMFPDQRVSYPVPGEIEDIAKITRDKVLGFYKSKYIVENFVVSICSDLDSEKVFDLCETYFSDMPSGTAVKDPEIIKSETKEYFVRVDEKVNQATAHIIYHANPRTTDDYYRVSYLTSILGTRLFDKIRGKLNLCYSVGASNRMSYDYAYVDLSMRLDEKNLKVATQALREEMDDLMKNLPTEKEFNREQKSIQADFVFSNEDPAGLASLYAYRHLFNLPASTPDELLAKYMSVTPDDVRKTANEVFSQNEKVFVLSKNLSEDDVRKIW